MVLCYSNHLVVYSQWICMLKANSNSLRWEVGKPFPEREPGESATKHGVLARFSPRPLLALGFLFSSPWNDNDSLENKFQRAVSGYLLCQHWFYLIFFPKVLLWTKSFIYNLIHPPTFEQSLELAGFRIDIYCLSCQRCFFHTNSLLPHEHRKHSWRLSWTSSPHYTLHPSNWVTRNNTDFCPSPSELQKSVAKSMGCKWPVETWLHDKLWRRRR